MTIEDKISILSKTPHLIKEFIEETPKDLLKQRRITNKWSIHEHLCHLNEVQNFLKKRLEKIKSDPHFKIEIYNPPNDSENNYLELDLKQQMQEFERVRQEVILLLQTFTTEEWNKEIPHPEFTSYSAAILTRHMFIHEHLHLCRIEELAITKEKYLSK